MESIIMYEERLSALRVKLEESGIDVALITDEDNVYYLTGYYDYLHMDFGRPTILVVLRDGISALITPVIDMVMAESSAHVDRLFGWNDGAGSEWRESLSGMLGLGFVVGLESERMPPLVRSYISELVPIDRVCDIRDLLSGMRMVKSAFELQLARHAGEVALSMMSAGRSAIGAGVAEYEVALATSRAGTLKSAELLSLYYEDSLMSPFMHFLQIMASGDEITKTHHRASVRVMQRGEPVFLCFCGMTNFHRFKLGFDRTFWIGEVADESQAEIYEVAVASQRAALSVLRAGVSAESVHAAYADVIRGAGYDYPFRCGRATGFSFLESPQLVSGDETILRSGMVFAVDGSVCTDSFRAQIGDSFIVTDDGYEALTDYPKSLSDAIV